MSRMKKVLAVFVTLVMLVTMTVAVSAEFDDEMADVGMFMAEETDGTGETGATGTEDTTTTETKIPTVAGVVYEEGIKVTGYQIIKYNDENHLYEAVREGSITLEDGKLAPNPTDVQKLANDLTDLESAEFSRIEEKEIWTCESLAAGTWMIIITGSSKYLYNPAIVSVMATTAGPDGGNLVIPDNWEEYAYVKKSEPDITKKAVTENVKSVQYGDVVQFEITADVPNYTDLAIDTKDLQYKITDSFEGFEFVSFDFAQVGNIVDGVLDKNAIDIDKSLLPQVNGSMTTFTVDLSPEPWGTAVLTPPLQLGDKRQFIKSHRGEKIVIKYSVKVTSATKYAVDKLTNKVDFTYSINDGVIQTKNAKTIHYTFGIDTAFGHEFNTGEFIKINDSTNAKVQYDENGQATVVDGKALSGAEFKLCIRKDESGTLGAEFKDASGSARFTTDINGRLEINGLDSDVVYWLVEVTPPTGYTLVDTPISIEIVDTYDENGILTGYKVKIGGQEVANYTYTDNETTDGTIEFETNRGTPYAFKNTKVGELPSTGGIGTTIFTTSGCILMILAAAIFFAGRRKDNK